MTTPHARRPPSGDQYNTPVYRDELRLLTAESTDTAAITLGDPMTEAAFETAISAFHRGALASTLGLVPGGGGDGLKIFCLGTTTANQTVSMTVTAYRKCIQFTGASGGWVVVNYTRELVGVFTWTLGALVAGAADPPLPSGMDASDLWADTVVLADPDPATEVVPNGSLPPGFVTHSAANDSKAYIIVPGDGVEAWRIQTDVGSATSAYAFGHRVRGDSMRS